MIRLDKGQAITFGNPVLRLNGVTIINGNEKPIFIRERLQSVTVSDRKPAAYGVKKIQPNRSK